MRLLTLWRVSLVMLFSTIGLFSSNTYAVVPQEDPFANAPCLTSQNGVCVQEIGGQKGGTLYGQYQITNRSGQEIFMFGVTNFNATNAYSSIYADQDQWAGKTITKDEWNNTDQLFGAFSGSNPEENMYEYNGRDLGTFESLFGTDDTSVNIYWHLIGADLNPFTSGTLNKFYWDNSPPNSQVTVFGVDGNVLATSVAAVPEPETYAMLMAGLGLMGFVARRRKV